MLVGIISKVCQDNQPISLRLSIVVQRSARASDYNNYKNFFFHIRTFETTVTSAPATETATKATATTTTATVECIAPAADQRPASTTWSTQQVHTTTRKI